VVSKTFVSCYSLIKDFRNLHPQINTHQQSENIQSTKYKISFIDSVNIQLQRDMLSRKVKYSCKLSIHFIWNTFPTHQPPDKVSNTSILIPRRQLIATDYEKPCGSLGSLISLLQVQRLSAALHHRPIRRLFVVSRWSYHYIWYIYLTADKEGGGKKRHVLGMWGLSQELMTNISSIYFIINIQERG
jgi:hypothetical protein